MVRGAHEIGVGGTVFVLDVRSVDQRTLRRELHLQRHQNGLAAGGLSQRAAVSPGARRARDPASGSDLHRSLRTGCLEDATNRVTVNAGLRWEPFFGQNVQNGAISNFSLDNFRSGVEEHGVHERTGWSHVSRRPRISIRELRHEPAVVEPVAPRGCRLGRDRDRPHGGAHLVRIGVRLHDRSVPLHRGLGGAVCESPPAGGDHVRRSLCGRTWRRHQSDSRGSSARRAVPGVRLVRFDVPGHQFAEGPVMERHRRTADRYGLAGGGELSGQLQRSPLGPGGDQPWRIPGNSVPARSRE